MTDLIKIPKNKVLSVKRCGTKVVSIRRKYVTELNQVCSLDSNYEYNYALFLDYLYTNGDIKGWVRNTTKFAFSKPVTYANGKVVSSYRPDFIVFGDDGTYEIHEVKGWMNDRSKLSMQQFKKDYPYLKLKVIYKDDMLALQSEYESKLWGWENVR